MSIYHIMDKTMLGIISDYENSGYYYSADKIINIPMGIISGFSTVILPRFSSLVSENRMNEYRRLFLPVASDDLCLRATLPSESPPLPGNLFHFSLAQATPPVLH